MKFLHGFFVVVLCIGFAFNAYAEGDFAGESMSIGVGARPLGMGGTFAAIADDASTSYWNSAGMTSIVGVEVSSVKLTKINDLDTKYSYVNLVSNMGESAGALGIGWLRQAIGDIFITNTQGDIITVAENSDNTVYLAYANSLAKGFSAGATVKVLLGSYPALDEGGTNYMDVGYTGFGLDIGLLANIGDFAEEIGDLRIGVNIQDVYTAITWDSGGSSSGGEETVPLNIKPGISYTLPVEDFEVTAALDLDTKYQMLIHAGLEVWWNKMIGLRGGIKSYGELEGLQQESDWSMGASLRWYFIGIDYAYVSNELTPVQYLSIIGKF
ncbi:MAG: PorV/PorQ family protein [Candidatus Goldiibacteriota bacterium]